MGLLDLFSDTLRAPAECLVELDGDLMSDMYPALIEVVVEADRTRWTTATLILETRRMEDGSWTIQDDPRFRPWAPIRIDAQFGSDVQEVMRGYVREVKSEYPEEKGGAKVTVTCQDESLRLDREHVEQLWGEGSPATDSSIVSEIAQRRNVPLLGSPGEGQTVVELNQNTTDIRFLKTRADANGFELLFKEGEMHFGEMRLDAETQPNILVYAGTDTNCISFEIQDDGHQPDRIAFQVAAESGTESPPVEVKPNLKMLGTEFADSSDSGLDPFVWRPRRQGINDENQMQAVAQSRANEQSMKIKVQGELDGSMYGHVLNVGEPVGVDGVGEKLSGTYYVDKATHRFDVNGYRVRFQLIRNAYGDDL
jgi:hypothetical protein